MTTETYGDYGPVPMPPRPRRFYIAVEEVVAGFYGSSLRVSIPEPDGEVMLTIVDHDGYDQADIYIDPVALFEAIARVDDAYAHMTPEEKPAPTYRPAANHPPVEGNHP